MTNVLVDLHRLGGNKYNGLYHYCYQLGKYMAKVAPVDLDIHYYMPEKMKGIFGDDVNYAIQHSRDKYFRFGTGRFDVWHVATSLSWYRPYNRKVKNVFTIHDLNFLEVDEYSPSSKKKYHRLIQQRADRADHLTFISKFARTQAEKYLRLGEKPYTIIYNGCNVPEDLPTTDPGYKPSRPFLFAIGQVHSRKNFHVLPSLLKNNDYELVIAGMNDFPYAARVNKEAKRWDVAERVIMTGPVTDDEKYWYYEHCAAFVFPSIAEGFGLPVIEAMYFGKPVFISAYTSLPEVGGDVAYYFDSFEPEHMRDVFEKGMEHYLATEPIVQIKRQAAKFKWENTVEEYFNVYRKLS